MQNVPASVKQRLLNRSREEHRLYGELQQYYAMERFLYRLSQSAHASCFILKGALMLRAWRSPSSRSTMDIDLLGRTSNAEADIAGQIRDIMAVEVELDGMLFDPASIATTTITEDADYVGVRVLFRGTLGKAVVHMQIDIGFDDVVVPAPEMLELPALLGYPAPRLFCYSRESAIAEKFEAMVRRGELNSRMKDFFDIWLLSRQFDFNGALLTEAVTKTCEHRGTVLGKDVVAFTEGFARAKQTQWRAFKSRLGQDHAPDGFSVIVADLKRFLLPVVDAATSTAADPGRWKAPGPWLP